MDEKIIAMVLIALLGAAGAYFTNNGYILMASITGIAGLAGFKLPVKP